MSFEAFFWEMARFVPPEARIMTCQFRGDPNSDIYGKWKARVMRDPSFVDEGANVYLCVSAMKQNARGEFRRRKDNFCGGLLLMIDDIGHEGAKGAKFPLSILDPLPPTAMIETSPGNFQAVYMFDRLVDDMELFDALIRAFIERQFLGADTGQAGVNRVFRPPAGINGKPKYHDENGQPWRVRLAGFDPSRRYGVEEIARAYGLSLVRGRRVPRGATGGKGDKIRNFMNVRGALRAAGMLKREEADYSGWIPVTCPWTHHHTDGADNGAAIRLPEPENDWVGGFKCHHSGCNGRGWRDLTEWLAAEQLEMLELTNRNSGEYHEYHLGH